MHAFTVAASPSTIHCPAPTLRGLVRDVPARQPFSPATASPAAAVSGGFIYEFECSVPRDADRTQSAAPLPAGTVVNGAFTTDPERPVPSFTSVQVTASQQERGNSKVSRPTTIPVS